VAAKKWYVYLPAVKGDGVVWHRLPGYVGAFWAESPEEAAQAAHQAYRGGKRDGNREPFYAVRVVEIKDNELTYTYLVESSEDEDLG